MTHRTLKEQASVVAKTLSEVNAQLEIELVNANCKYKKEKENRDKRIIYLIKKISKKYQTDWKHIKTVFYCRRRYTSN